MFKHVQTISAYPAEFLFFPVLQSILKLFLLYSGFPANFAALFDVMHLFRSLPSDWTRLMSCNEMNGFQFSLGTAFMEFLSGLCSAYAHLIFLS